METALGIFIRVKNLSTGERTNERKIARKNGNNTGLANFNTTPEIKITMRTSDPVAILLLFIPDLL